MITMPEMCTWMKQAARKLTDAQDGFLRGGRYLILDRDPLYTAAFRHMLRKSGVKPLLLPARSPNLNACAERFVLFSCPRVSLDTLLEEMMLLHGGGHGET